ncbi:sensor histidine kinase [Pedobacter sp. MC2016-24]|uniref:sensor histidine kinase n=1 Tax=Pedobacter sp. MC2016-24 TaxID=2780090 RepID=UPI00187F3AAC|nr:histidine kinase [Pedobacter sp. MC2016-24]MBE9602337.1 histidine kinase [Pedobacter sp. MC2016-24]
MKESKAKHLLLITFTIIGSYLTIFIVYPYSYWTEYASWSVSRKATDILANVLFCGILVVLSLFIDRKLNKRIPWMVHPLKRLLIQVMFQVFGVLLLIICLGSLYAILELPVPKSSALDVRQSLYTIVLIILWPLIISTLNTGDYLLKNWKNAALKSAEFEIKAAQNKQLAAEIELQALKLQLDPHFVFNNLSVLSELILQDQQLGHEYTENFAKVYRYLLINAKKKLISLSEELKFLDAYLFLVKNRMGGGTTFRIDVDESRLELQIPPVTLQLFIENALKHNRTEEENPLVISIYTNDLYELVVSNNILPLIKKTESTGLGLENIMSRYALLGDRKPVVEKNDHTFTVKVPLIKYEYVKENIDSGR